jgi:WD40 repeat protein
VVAEWNAVTGRALGPPVVIHGGSPVDVSFAPHGATVAVSGFRFGVAVVDPAKGRIERRFSVRGGLWTMGAAYSPDGDRLATTDWSGSVDLWDPSTGRMIGAPIPDPGQAVTNAVAWSPDGSTIAVTDWSNTLRLFDVATRQELGPSIPVGNPNGDTTYPYVTFTPDGSKVVVSDDTGQVWVVPVSLKAWEDRACQIAGRNLTRVEWQQFVTGRGYADTCPQFPAG